MRHVDVSMATGVDSDWSDDDNDRLPLATMGPSTAEAVVAIQV